MSCAALSLPEQERAAVLMAQSREFAVDLFVGDRRVAFAISACDWCHAIAQAIQSAGLCHEAARRVTFDVREV